MATFMNGMSGGLRLKYATEPTLATRAALQVVLTTAQVRELGVALGRLADRLEAELAAVDNARSRPN